MLTKNEKQTSMAHLILSGLLVVLLAALCTILFFKGAGGDKPPNK